MREQRGSVLPDFIPIDKERFEAAALAARGRGLPRGRRSDACLCGHREMESDDTDGGANMAGLGSVGAATGMVDTRGAVPYARAESAALAEAWPFTAAAVGVGPDLRFSSRWLDSRSLLVSAAIRDSSPARTLAATTRARLAAFSPGFSVAAPRTPRSWRSCGASWLGRGTRSPRRPRTSTPAPTPHGACPGAVTRRLAVASACAHAHLQVERPTRR